ncbi:hypothetical protein GCM10010193_29980 [Kitasatospora atroaurantiaca]|uniref:Lactococcin 972 family bacteriocin n=1 Tax=Kitasatospora atroaurantiaca TaxID=285545 RepID=A0A561EQU3_9ACTN|nr:hypothetical protein [Kitasatospora atroaurantiaca]TWE17986.1 hypothetical protein FB465_3033 [Kitasatospora atroaurantiaca]
MKSMLGKALLTTVGALAIAGVSAPAYAHVDAGGGGHFIATAEEPFVAGEQHGWAVTDHIFVAGHQWGWATSTATGGGAEGIVHID